MGGWASLAHLTSAGPETGHSSDGSESVLPAEAAQSLRLACHSLNAAYFSSVNLLAYS